MTIDVRGDAEMILTEGGFETEITFTKSDESTLIINGLAIRRTETLEYDDGSKSNTPFSSVLVPLSPFEFTDNYISMPNWKVEFVEDTITRTFYASEPRPNYTTGTVTVTLKDE